MFKPLIIKKIVAAFMVVVFAISITPTIVFHNWLADHSDTVRKSTEAKGDQFGKQTFNCHCDHIVAESPFTEPSKVILTYSSLSFSSAKTDVKVHFNSSQHFLYSLRGPPTV